MKTVIAILLATTAIAKADIIEADFSGTSSGIDPYVPFTNGVPSGPYFTNYYNNVPFTARFFFNTDLSTVQEISPGIYQLSERPQPIVEFSAFPYATITLPAISPYPGPQTLTANYYIIYGTLTWQDGVGPIAADVNGGYYHISASLSDYGFFQAGPCPNPGTPCGNTFATSSTLMGTFPVPSTAAGSIRPLLKLLGLR